MKKLIYYIALSAMCLLPAACSLEEEISTEVEKENYLNDAGEAQNVLLGIYLTNVRDAMYGYNMSIYFSMGTDIAQVEGSTTENFRILPTNAYPTTQAEVQQTWESLYTGIYRANDFLEGVSAKINTYSEKDKALVTIYMGEARALRAMYYFELVRRYENIPLMTSTQMSNQNPNTFVQADPIDVYKFIEDDLTYASEVLPYAKDDTYREDNSFRFSKGAALGLLTKVYATWASKDASKWENAANTASILVESGKHDLLPDYKKLWENTCNSVWDPTESLIEISFYSPTYSNNSDPVGRIGKWNGVKTTVNMGKSGSCAGNMKVVHTFVLDWREGNNAGDLRRDLSVANYKYGDKETNGRFYWAAKVTDDEATALDKDQDPEKSQKEKQALQNT